MSTTRKASHAGSWYSASRSELSAQLDGFLDAVNEPVDCIGTRSQGTSLSKLPLPGARIIIAPHAGYSYSGPAAAYAYKAWDLSKAKRVFLLGPSHHHYLTKAAITQCAKYETPLGTLQVDKKTTAELHTTGLFENMTRSIDEDEHSLEMHLPYIYKMFTRHFGDDPSQHPSLVPIMVGNTSAATERALAARLVPYLNDPSTAWIISSDFAHWGLRFRYTYYQPEDGPATHLTSGQQRPPQHPPIYQSIRAVDFDCINACEGGSHQTWLQCLEDNGNTVCGRHPIGVMMAALELSTADGKTSDAQGLFHFVRYEQSSEVYRIKDSSVSYASAFATL